MSSAISIAAGGIQTAARSFEVAARNIVSATTFAAGDTNGTATAPSYPAAQLQTPSPVAPVFDVPDFGQSVVDLKLAEISYKANIEVFKAASRLQDEALNMLA